jgi:hypothetical protein
MILLRVVNGTGLNFAIRNFRLHTPTRKLVTQSAQLFDSLRSKTISTVSKADGARDIDLL